MDPHGCTPFQQWFEDLDTRATAQVTVALTRLDQGNVFHVNGVGGRLLELWHGLPHILRERWWTHGHLPGRGMKKRQNRDIRTAQDLWTAYKARRQQER